MPQDKARLYQGIGMEVLTTAEMERADRLTIAAGTPGFALMLSAGQAVAEAAMDLVEEGPILVVAGRGNNGGAGFVAAAGTGSPRTARSRSILLCERDSLQGVMLRPRRVAGNSPCCRSIPSDRQPAADHRCGVRRRSEPVRQGRSAGDDRGDQRQWRARAQR